MAKQVKPEVVQLRRFENDESKLKAFVDIAIGEFVVRGFRIVEGEEGLFVGMPQDRGKDGRWYERFSPKTPEARQALTEAVLAAYQDGAATCEA